MSRNCSTGVSLSVGVPSGSVDFSTESSLVSPVGNLRNRRRMFSLEMYESLKGMIICLTEATYSSPGTVWFPETVLSSDIVSISPFGSVLLVPGVLIVDSI
jgi:hypothetical protein